LIFETERYLAFLRSLTDDELLRVLLFVYSLYLNPAPDGAHIFDYDALGTPEIRFAFDGEFRIDFFVVSDDAIVLLAATRARRLPD
jgi:hypothetical protein